MLQGLIAICRLYNKPQPLYSAFLFEDNEANRTNSFYKDIEALLNHITKVPKESFSNIT